MSFRLFALVALSLVAVASATCSTNPSSVIVPPPQLVVSTASTHLTTDLKISYTSPNGQLFSSVVVSFKNPTTNTYNSLCDIALGTSQLTGSGTTNLGTYGAWSTTPTNTGTSCDTSFAGDWSTTQAFHDALNQCFAFDNTTDATYNFFTANVQIVTIQDANPIRGVAVSRTVTAYTRFQFKLQRVVTIAATPTVNGQNLASADVVAVIYGEINPSSSTSNVITVYFFTSTPAPYKLSPWTIANVYGAGLSSTPSGIGASLQGAAPYNVELFAYPSGISGPALICGTNDTFCTQLWKMQFVYTGVGSSGTCSPFVTVRFSYSVQCNGAPGCVVPGNINSYDLTSTLSATNLCSQLIQTTTVTPTIALYQSDADATAGTNAVVTFNVGDTIYSVTSLTSNNGPTLASASLISFNLVSAITINGISLTNTKGVNGVNFKLYAPTGNTIRAGLSFVADTNALQFNDLNVNQGVTISISWTVVYNLPLSNQKLVLSSNGHMALMDTPSSEDVSVTTAFVLSTDSGAPAAASSSNTLAIAIGAAGGFCVVALIAALFMYHRHVRNMMRRQDSASKVQIFVPMTSTSNLQAAAPAPTETAPADAPTQV